MSFGVWIHYIQLLPPKKSNPEGRMWVPKGQIVGFQRTSSRSVKWVLARRCESWVLSGILSAAFHNFPLLPDVSLETRRVCISALQISLCRFGSSARMLHQASQVLHRSRSLTQLWFNWAYLLCVIHITDYPICFLVRVWYSPGHTF